MATDTDRSRFVSLALLPERHPAMTFFALALAFSWGVWIPALTALPVGYGTLALIPGAFGPMAAAAVVTLLRGESVRAWLTDCLDWRRSLRPYAVAFGLPVAVSAAVLAALVAMTGTFEASAIGRVLPLFAFNVVFASLLGGGQEEFGWRGFALPHLQRRYDALTASLVIGVVWALWHAPLFALGVPGYAEMSFPLYAGVVLGFAVVFTWFYNGTRGCLPAAVLLHGTVNAAVNVPPLFVGGPDALPVPFAAVLLAAFWTVALVLLAWHGRESIADEPKVTSERIGRVGTDARREATRGETGVDEA